MAKEKRMEFLRSFRPTSKMQLKQMCQWYCDGDIKKAQEMYEFYSNDIKLPDFDPVPLTFQQQLKENANGLLDWIKTNQDTLAQGYEFIRQIIANKGKLPSLSIAEDVEESAELPPIND